MSLECLRTMEARHGKIGETRYGVISSFIVLNKENYGEMTGLTRADWQTGRLADWQNVATVTYDLIRSSNVHNSIYFLRFFLIPTLPNSPIRVTGGKCPNGERKKEALSIIMGSSGLSQLCT